jgi:hypothetical protein
MIQEKAGVPNRTRFYLEVPVCAVLDLPQKSRRNNEERYYRPHRGRRPL